MRFESKPKIIKWFPTVYGHIPCIQEPLQNRKRQEVYFPASSLCGLNVNHAYLLDTIKEYKRSEKDAVRNAARSLDMHNMLIKIGTTG